MRSWLAFSFALPFLLLALFAMLPQSALALTASQVYEQVKDSVVVVKAYDRQGKITGLGSGVMLPSGDIITNYHVVKSGARYTVGQGKQATLATLKAGDPDKDLCLLTAPGLTAKPAHLGKAARLKVGDTVYAVGAPQGLELSLSEGIVSQLRGGLPPIIQTTVAISRGSSGGGLFNAKGELVGITTFYLKNGQSLNFALPVEWIGEVVAKGKKTGGFVLEPDVSGLEAKPKEGWANRARALVKAENWQGLLAWCRRWTGDEPGNSFAWFSLGIAYKNLGRYRESAEAYRRAQRLVLDSAGQLSILGDQYREMGRYREAVEAYLATLRLKPDYAEVWNNLGAAYGNLGQYREAIAAFREALRLTPDDAVAWYNLGVTYKKEGRYREEIEAYLEALHLKPDFADAWENLALAYAQMRNRRAALEALKQLRRYNPQQAEKLFNLIVKP